MFEKKFIMYMYAETPLHAGAGGEIKAIDLPLQRERHTQYPMIQGSSIKGVMRNSAKSLHIEDIDGLFGSKDGVGGISITDARLLAFPVRSLKGVFGWITSPFVLNRYARDLKIAGKEIAFDIGKIEDGKAIVSQESNLVYNNHLYIEDVEFAVEIGEIKNIANEISKAFPSSKEYDAIRNKFVKDLAIVSDDVFKEFVSLSTEVVTRIKINPDTGTVDKKTGGLWSEEYLPSDTILYSLILIPNRNEKQKIEESLKIYNERILQIGGDETIGKGLVRIELEEGKNVEKY